MLELHTNQIAFRSSHSLKMKISSLPVFQTNNVERDFLSSLNRVFSKFGENKGNLVLSKFETDYNLSRNEILDHPELFSRTLQNIFRFGSTYVEKAIISELVQEFTLTQGNYKRLSDVASEIRKSEFVGNS
jgi:hypothetical protein